MNKNDEWEEKKEKEKGGKVERRREGEDTC